MNLKSFLIHFFENNLFKKKDSMKDYIYKFFELYLYKLTIFNKKKKYFFLLYNEFVHKIFNTRKFNLDNESLCIEFKKKVLNE